MLAPIALGLFLLAHPPDAPKPSASCCADKPVLLAMAAKCTGSASCRACSNCSRCAYCKGGGSCGACTSNRTPPPTIPKPTSPTGEVQRKRRPKPTPLSLEPIEIRVGNRTIRLPPPASYGPMLTDTPSRRRAAFLAEPELMTDADYELAATEHAQFLAEQEEARQRAIIEDGKRVERQATDLYQSGVLLEKKKNPGGALTIFREVASKYTSTNAGREAAAKVVTLDPFYEVVRVVDGDTLIVRLDGKPTTVRLIGVDTPETVHPQKPVERFCKEASDFLKGTLKGGRVRLEYEPGSGQDRYGRLLAYAYLPSGRSLNLEIIERGYGFAYIQYPFRRMTEFRAAEGKARSAKVGMWADESSAARGASEPDA